MWWSMIRLIGTCLPVCVDDVAVMGVMKPSPSGRGMFAVTCWRTW